MKLFRHPIHRASANAEAEPTGFCDACGSPLYDADMLTVQVEQMVLSLHGTCAAALENAVQRARWSRIKP